MSEVPCDSCVMVFDASKVLGYTTTTVQQYLAPSQGKLVRCESCGYVVEESVLALREANDARAAAKRGAAVAGVEGEGSPEAAAPACDAAAPGDGSSYARGDVRFPPSGLPGERVDRFRVEPEAADGADDRGGVPENRGAAEVDTAESDDDDHRDGPVADETSPLFEFVDRVGKAAPKSALTPELFEKALANRIELFGLLPPAPPPEFDATIAYAWGRVAGCLAAFGDDGVVTELATEINGLGRVLVDQLVLPAAVIA